MHRNHKILLLVLMSSALLFGYLPLLFPDFPYPFERLHIFLFNLVSGGTIVIYHTENKGYFSAKIYAFLILALTYAGCAFLNKYLYVMLISLILAGIVESVRIRKFSVFPTNFFDKTAPQSEKFHQASLLCLSMGLIIATLVILNNTYLHLVDMPKLQLDTFFLGFSFPLSLISFSVIFSLMNFSADSPARLAKEMGFWFVNLGVIIFFIFIIFEKIVPQVVVTLILFFTVLLIFFLFLKLVTRLQQKAFLSSGMFFLIVTAITGILYIFLELTPDYAPDKYKWLLRLHAYASLYGWNMCGLTVIVRYNDFPLKLHSRSIILLHWVTVILLAPLGNLYRPFALCTLICYTFFLYCIFFSQGKPYKPENSTAFG